jgi:hypothetical protein
MAVDGAIDDSGAAFFEPDGVDTYLPTEHTAGPWDPRFQHGGPPTALLTRAIERELGDDGLRLGRVSYEILGPVPRTTLRTSTTVRRPGRRVRLIEATLSAGDRPVITASAWAVRPASDDLPVDTIPPAGIVPPDEAPVLDPTTYREWDCGFLAATEWRFVSGDYRGAGPATVWVRAKVPLLAGEVLSPAQRVALSADSANGVSAVLDIGAWTFIPPELTIHFLRPAVGEWLCLDAQSLVGPNAVGLATATLHDLGGPVARSAQTLYVSRRDAVG